MKQFIQNRKNQKVCVVVEGPEAPGKLAFIMHGLSGYKEEPHLRAMAEVFLAAGYTLVTFDTTCTFGESDGEYQDATLTGYYEDLEDVIVWAATQPWYVEPFVLVGHSFGGISTALFAAKYHQKVRALAPISTVVSGGLSMQTPKYGSKEMLDEWKRTGIHIFRSKDGTEKPLKWACMEDRLRYDLLPEAPQLTMPVLLVVGSNDSATPPAHQQILFDALPGQKEMHVIDGATHTFDRESEREQLQQFVKAWLEKL